MDGDDNPPDKRKFLLTKREGDIEICANWRDAQLAGTESVVLIRGGDPEGPYMYRGKRDCANCDGHNKSCPNYIGIFVIPVPPFLRNQAHEQARKSLQHSRLYTAAQ